MTDILKEDLKALENPGINSFEHISVSLKPYEWGLGSTPRTAQLREDLYSKAVVVKDWTEILSGVGKTSFRKDVKLDTDRAQIVTDSFKETEGLPQVTRRALIMKDLCEKIPIFIEPNQLLVGDPNSAPNEIRWYPEVSCEYMIDSVKPEGGFGHMVTAEERQQIFDICDYWKDRCQEVVVSREIPDDVLPYLTRSLDNPYFYANHWNAGRNILGYDYELLFKEGLNARIKRVETKLAELTGHVLEGMQDSRSDGYIEKKRNWEAQIISAKAILRFAERLAELAREQADGEADPKRKKELLTIAEACDKVPANPPETFYEAMQFHWLVEIVARFLSGPNNGSGARLDQLWHPYYKKDILEGRITRNEAKELLECWMIRIQALGSHAEHPQLFSLTSGSEVFYTANIGGSHMDGTDACNDLTALMLENIATLRMNQPPLMVRMHRNMPENMLTRITEAVRAGTGHPSLFNEELMEKWALVRGYSEYDAKRTQAAGCVAMNCTGKPLSGAFMTEVGIVAQPKILEYALFQGNDAFGTGNRVGDSQLTRPKTKDPQEMSSAEDLLDAHCEQLIFYIKHANVSHNIGHQVMMEFSPNPMDSFLLEDTLEQGKDIHKAWAEFDTWPNLVSLGYVNVSDSLAAIDKLVFQDKKYTMNQLINALQKNWEGNEEMRQDFLNAPKYGNDEDVVDQWAATSRGKILEAARTIKDAWGRPWDFDGSSVIAYQAMAFGIGATADGRHAANMMADGSRSPSAGADIEGPTAVLNSVAKIPYMHSELFNQRFMPQFLEGENKALFNAYLREWFDKMTIPHIQFNVVDSNMLRDAQNKPDDYPDLQVRIAGYSAYFVDLAPETQESIIQRTEHAFV